MTHINSKYANSLVRTKKIAFSTKYNVPYQVFQCFSLSPALETISIFKKMDQKLPWFFINLFVISYSNLF